MNTKHTPGPWLRKGHCVYALMHHAYVKGVEQFKNRFSVNVMFDRDCHIKEAEANARLIAAAPELLDALVMARAIVAMYGGTPDPMDPYADQIQVAIQKQIADAINKATGE